MRLSTPKFLRLWMADIVLRLIHLTNYGLIIEPALGLNFLWYTERYNSGTGRLVSRKLLSPRWQHQDVIENTGTMADGHRYRFIDFKDKK